jgi:hypothetical protein
MAAAPSFQTKYDTRCAWHFKPWFSLRQSGALFLNVFVFALCERKNKNRKTGSTRAITAGKNEIEAATA